MGLAAEGKENNQWDWEVNVNHTWLNLAAGTRMNSSGRE